MVIGEWLCNRCGSAGNTEEGSELRSYINSKSWHLIECGKLRKRESGMFQAWDCVENGRIWRSLHPAVFEDFFGNTMDLQGWRWLILGEWMVSDRAVWANNPDHPPYPTRDSKQVGISGMWLTTWSGIGLERLRGQGILEVAIAVVGNFLHAFHGSWLLWCFFFQFCGPKHGYSMSWRKD